MVEHSQSQSQSQSPRTKNGQPAIMGVVFSCRCRTGCFFSPSSRALTFCGGRGLLRQSGRPHRRDGVRLCPLCLEITVSKLESERDLQTSGVISDFVTTYWLYSPLTARLRRCYFLEYLTGEMLPVRTDARRHCTPHREGCSAGVDWGTGVPLNEK